MEEKRYLGMPTNAALGLSWVAFPFGIVLLAIEHEKMDKEDKQQVVSCFVLCAMEMIVTTIISIIDSILYQASGATWFGYFHLVEIVFLVFWLIAMIQAFRGVKYHCPLSWGIAGSFVKDTKENPSSKKEETKEETKEE